MSNIQSGSRIALANATEVLTSAQQDAMPTTCSECDHECDNTLHNELCCNCGDFDAKCQLCVNVNEAAYENACTPRS